MAGRIPQHFIDQLLNRIDIVDLIDGYVPLKKAGANYKANCPFHGEKTPSFTVSPSKQFYHCFGCGENGTAISFLMNYDHMEFREAIEKLAASAGLEIPTEAQTTTSKATLQRGVDLYALMEQISSYYQQQLRQHPDRDKAVDYLQHRGLSGEVAQRYGIGYAPEGWDNLMRSHGATPALQKALLDAGMLSQNDKQRIYDRFRHRIMFPIHDHRGRVVGFGGRVLDQSEPKYLNSPETPIFHKGSELYGLYAARGGIKEADGVLVVEGYMDVVALAQAGIDNAVATLGTATTPMHLQRLLRHTSNITFSFDGDRAGLSAAWKALLVSLPQMQDGYQISFLFLPEGEDPDSMVRKIGKEGFQELLKDAQPLTQFMIDHLRQQADLSRLDGRAKLAKLARPLIAQLPDGVLRKLLVEQLARMAQLTAQDLLTPDTKPSRGDHTRGQTRKQHAQPLPMTVVRRLISLLLQYPHLGALVDAELGLEKMQVHGIELLRQLVQQCQQNDVNTATLLERHRQERHFAALEKLASHDHLLEEQELEPAFHTLLARLAAQSTDTELENLLEKARESGLDDGEKQRLNALLNSQNSLL